MGDTEAMDTTTARAVAQTIKKQLGIPGLGVVGAHDFAFTKEGTLAFKARLHFKGQTRVRISRVEVSLNGMDLYDINVYHPLRTNEFATDVYAEDLVKTMYRLDREGF